MTIQADSEKKYKNNMQLHVIKIEIIAILHNFLNIQ